VTTFGSNHIKVWLHQAKKKKKRKVITITAEPHTNKKELLARKNATT
jgi:hypothetical protein